MIYLTPQQQTVLRAFLSDERIIKHEAIVEALTADGYGAFDLRNVAKVRVTQLRKLLGLEILNIWGVGYELSDADRARLIELDLKSAGGAPASPTKAGEDAVGSPSPCASPADASLIARRAVL